MNQFADEITETIKSVSESEGLEYDIDLWMDEAPVLMDKGLVDRIEQSADQIVGKE